MASSQTTSFTEKKKETIIDGRLFVKSVVMNIIQKEHDDSAAMSPLVEKFYQEASVRFRSEKKGGGVAETFASIRGVEIRINRQLLEDLFSLPLFGLKLEELESFGSEDLLSSFWYVFIGNSADKKVHPSCHKKRFVLPFVYLHDFCCRVVENRTGAFEMCTNLRFRMMVAIMFGEPVNWCQVILKRLQEEVSKPLSQKKSFGATQAYRANIRGLVSRKEITEDKAEKALLRLKGVLDYAEFKDVDLAIEAVVENISLKQKIFIDIEKACPPHCILSSNTSTIDLNVVGEKTKSQDRIVGAHFFSPAHLMTLVEVVRTEKTSSQVILDLITIGKTIHKVPVVVQNCTGFAVNRTFFPYSQSAHLLVNLGVDVFRIDQLIINFGLPIGPFQGKINGKGYYIYEKGSKPKPDFSVLTIIEESRRLTNIMPGRKPMSVTDEEVVKMILFPVVNEACRVLDDGVVIRASDLDVASLLGMSFPSYRGGIVFWADTIGAGHIYRCLQTWTQVYGNFFKPSRFLEERARKGIPLGVFSRSNTNLREVCVIHNLKRTCFNVFKNEVMPVILLVPR
ncbi:Altered inheritance of mitochondria protein 1 [Orobanche hederae]